MHKGQLDGRKPNGAKGKHWRESCRFEDADGKRHATWSDCVLILVVGLLCIGFICSMPKLFPSDPIVEETIQRIEARNLSDGTVEVVEETMQDEDDTPTAQTPSATAAPTNEPPKQA